MSVIFSFPKLGNFKFVEIISFRIQNVINEFRNTEENIWNL